MTQIGRFTERHGANRGVSPVIGVILMVAITVILAAVIGTFVLDMGQQAGDRAPSASLRVDADSVANNVTVSHVGGDGLRSASIRIRVEKVGESGTESATYDAVAGDRTLAVGDDAVIAMGSTTDGVYWSDDGSLTYTNAADEFGDLAPGDRVTVTLVHTRSHRVIYETTVTA